LFGGTDTGSTTGSMNDTWFFNGSTWVEIDTKTRPRNLYLHTMVSDDYRERCVIYGGIPPEGGFFEETWEFDGSNWGKIEVENIPSGRSEHAACYDSVRHRTVLFGGYTWNGPARDTWEYYDTSSPTFTPVPTVTPSPTPEPTCDEEGVTLEMPDHIFEPGDACSLTANICNPNEPMHETPFFCLLEYAGAYWFYPDWTLEVDWEVLDQLPSGLTRYPVIDPFTWPPNVGVGTGFRFIGAITDPEMTIVVGTVGEWEFEWLE